MTTASLKEAQAYLDMAYIAASMRAHLLDKDVNFVESLIGTADAEAHAEALKLKTAARRMKDLYD